MRGSDISISDRAQGQSGVFRNAKRFDDIVISRTRANNAIVSTITDNFIGLGATFLLSLCEQKGRLDDVDIILMQNADTAPLSAENRAILRKIHPDLIVLDIDTSSFLTDETLVRYDNEGAPTRRNIDVDRLPSKKAVYLKLNVLRLAQYKTVLLLDSDLLIMGDFSELLDLPFEVAVAEAGQKGKTYALRYKPAGPKGGVFNSGVLLLGKACRGGDWFDKAVKVLFGKVGTHMQDQSVFNRLLLEREILYLPQTYNYKLDWQKKNFLGNKNAFNNAKIIHFIARGKWALKDQSNVGQKIYDYFHAVQKRTGAPFTLEP